MMATKKLTTIEKMVPIIEPLNPPTAAASEVMTDRSAVGRAETENSNLVQQLLCNHAETGPACGIGQQLDASNQKPHASKELACPPDIFNRVAGTQVVDSIAENQTRRREGEPNNSSCKKADNDEEEIGSYHAANGLCDDPRRFSRVKSSVCLGRYLFLFSFLLLGHICFFLFCTPDLDVYERVFLGQDTIGVDSACGRSSIL
ncbi:hypothetical protein HG531_000321 [Fusarium graminearum]|nr:hypothetical protein HG531_000321 [Fusarium graminearum]